VGGLVGLLAEAAAGGLIGVLVGVPEMGHLKVGVLAGVLLGLQGMNKGPVRVCLLLQQLPLRLMAEQVLLMRLTICLVLSLMIHKLRLQLLPGLLPMKVHVWSLLLWEMPWLLLRLWMLWMCCVTLPWQLLWSQILMPEISAWQLRAHLTVGIPLWNFLLCLQWRAEKMTRSV